jgi:SAM-dependent methyltransferase
MASAATANEEQDRFWNDVAGPLWVATEEESELHTKPFGDAALAVAAPALGERVLDVGCGCGSTTHALAAAVGPVGRVIGVDLSAVMLARAGERTATLSQVELRRADAQVAELDAAGFDLVFSRFGVMFFADPVAGFANLRCSLRPGGRLAFACWQAPSANLWMALVNRAAAKLFDLPAPPPHDAPGPFAFADRERIETVLAAAGFTAIEISSCQRSLHLGAGLRLEDWVRQRLVMGPARQPYLDSDGDRRDQVVASIVDIVSAYRAPGDDPLRGLWMDGAAWIVSARPADPRS